MAEIITFPKAKKNSPPQSKEEVDEKVAEFKEDFADQISEMVWRSVIIDMVRSGCDFDEDPVAYFPAMVLILESIKSLHLLTQGLEHPLQTFADESINLDDYTDEIDIILDTEEDMD
tara:strand:+ start:3048 stop:3398 length:351 start_codon:yes stop_codon:yes gene_type:complete